MTHPAGIGPGGLRVTGIPIGSKLENNGVLYEVVDRDEWAVYVRPLNAEPEEKLIKMFGVRAGAFRLSSRSWRSGYWRIVYPA